MKFSLSQISRFVFLSTLTCLVLPSFTYGQDFSLAGQNFAGIADYARSLVDIVVPILATGAFVVFFWGLAKFILNSGSAPEVEKGKQYMFWGIIVLFILLTYRAIVGLITGDFGWGNGQTIPQLNTSAGTKSVIDSSFVGPNQ